MGSWKRKPKNQDINVEGKTWIIVRPQNPKFTSMNPDWPQCYHRCQFHLFMTLRVYWLTASKHREIICRFSWKVAPSQALACHQQEGTGQPDVASASTLLHTFPHNTLITPQFCQLLSNDPTIVAPAVHSLGTSWGKGGGGVMSRMQVAPGSHSWLHLSILRLNTFGYTQTEYTFEYTQTEYTFEYTGAQMISQAVNISYQELNCCMLPHIEAVVVVFKLLNWSLKIESNWQAVESCWLSTVM